MGHVQDKWRTDLLPGTAEDVRHQTFHRFPAELLQLLSAFIGQATCLETDEHGQGDEDVRGEVTMQTVDHVAIVDLADVPQHGQDRRQHHRERPKESGQTRSGIGRGIAHRARANGIEGDRNVGDSAFRRLRLDPT